MFIKNRKALRLGNAADGSGSVNRKRPQCALWWAVVYSTTEFRLDDVIKILETFYDKKPNQRYLVRAHLVGDVQKSF